MQWLLMEWPRRHSVHYSPEPSPRIVSAVKCTLVRRADISDIRFIDHGRQLQGWIRLMNRSPAPEPFGVLIEEYVLAVQHGFLQGTFHDVNKGRSGQGTVCRSGLLQISRTLRRSAHRYRTANLVLSQVDNSDGCRYGVRDQCLSAIRRESDPTGLNTCRYGRGN
jgi:hypothetical protein